MKTVYETSHALLQRWLGVAFSKQGQRLPELTQHALPLQAELFSVEQMEKHAQTLTALHKLSQRPSADKLLDRLDENQKTLLQDCQTLSNNAHESSRISPAGEWLLDNFYLIEEQIRTSKRHLPKSYGRGLPKLAQGYSQGYPRVYDIALHVIAHGDGRWDPENLSRFISAYQRTTTLMLGELWAIPIMLRLALIESLAVVSRRVAIGRHHRNLADSWADRMEAVAESDPKSLILVTADMARSDPPLSSAFVAELARRLQGRGMALNLPLSWIEQRLAENELTLVQLVQTENQQQATNQTTVSNCIASLRRLGEMDWREFVEQMSAVHHILLQDPDAIYARMDFRTRDQYRHVVERLARLRQSKQHDPQAESTVAGAAISLARDYANQAQEKDDGRRSHVGFYLIGDGRRQLEHKVLTEYTWLQKVRRGVQSRPVRSYLGVIGCMTLALSAALLNNAYRDGLNADLAGLSLLGAALLVACSQLALALVNWVASHFVVPKTLPRLDFSKGIAPEFRTLVLVPTLLSSLDNIETLVEALEVRFLGNRDNALHFALLTDFNDAATEHSEMDETLLALAQTRIEELNRRYPGASGDIFFLFHRPRLWNAREKKWMGYERKRGKLSALNVLLRTNSAEARQRFSLIVGNTDALIKPADGHRVKYIITLDSDTQLPRESARQLVGTMAHPLNRPRYDAARQRVVEGHGILQPRMAEALPNPGPSHYASLFGSEPGIDPYTRTVSDVYQDLFDEGSFIGKGIYDIDVFEEVLGERFPENTILSHDLIEGCYLRSGLVSDVPLYEQSPGSYLLDSRRRMRWIRGDWQLFRWLLSTVPDKLGKKLPNPLSMLSQWKLFDNLRRSLVPVALLLILGMGWTVMATPQRWLGIVLLVLALPTLMSLLLELLSKPEEVLLSQHLLITLRHLYRRCAQLLLQLALLPHEAAYSLGAIVRSNWRMLISRRHLLEWTPSDQAGGNFSGTPLAWLRVLWAGPAFALATGYLLALYQPTTLLLAAPLLLLWLNSPFLAAWVSQPLQRKEAHLNARQLRFLHMTARKTWEYFAHFVSAEDNWLPPDNFQEAPREVVAHRTSPTNIGMALLANLSAHDFGYLSMAQLLERTGNTLRTMQGLERYRGHFYNWYDTQTLQTLPPRYVSTVDSGNLAGHLLVLEQGLLELLDAPLLAPAYYQGLIDTLYVLGEYVQEKPPALLQLRRQLQAIQHGSDTLENAAADLQALCASAEGLQKDIEARYQESPDAVTWAHKFSEHCHALHAEILLFACLTQTRNPSLRNISRLGPLYPAQATAIQCAQDRIALIESLAQQAHEMAQQDYDFLYDSTSHLMTVGFNADNGRKDRGHYDLLSSEARLGVYMAIAQGQVPQEAWFALGRTLTLSNGEPILVSWSGSMFEYLMPLLVMPSYDNTLLDQTCRTAVHRQIDYGKQRGVAWGVSESGFNAVDAQLNYQYRAFGVPGLGLKRGLAEDLVIAPYASVMALMVEPEAACSNLQRLAEEEALGRFGFYEAIDYTPARLPRGKSNALVRSFMAHHQGMSLLSLSYLLHQRPMQRRFAADPQIQAGLLLLQERIPKPVASYSQIAQAAAVTAERSVSSEAEIRVFDNPNTPTPEVHLLSNGRYHLMLTQAGGSYSRWKDLAVTRWRADGTSDNWGMFGYVRDVRSGDVWSTAYQPMGGQTDGFHTVFSEAHAEFTRMENGIEVRTEIGVSPEDDIELRRIRLRNRSRTKRTLEYTSYAEIVLAPHAADMAHPAFSNLFVETEILPQHHAILATRRPRSQQEQPPFLCHMLTAHSEEPCETSYETDRARFIGRGRTLAAPLAMQSSGKLSDSAGAVLDPIVAIRCRLTLEPGASLTLDLITGVSDTRAHCLLMAEKYRDRRLANRVFGLAWTHNQVLLRHLNASEADTQLYGRLAGAIIYSNARHRAASNILLSNQRGQSGLWGYSISGDLPIVLLHIADIANLGLVRQLLQAHAYWRQKGLAVDLVILNEESSNYRQVLQEQIIGLIPAGTGINTTDRNGGIFVRAAEQMPAEDRILLHSVAHVILSDRQGTLAEQLAYHPASRALPPPLAASPAFDNLSRETVRAPSIPSRELQFFNGLGGFKADGTEYVIELDAAQNTPAPWVNIIANPDFGTVISESGQAYTWTENAHETRLTPWDNDPIRDTGGELYYLRDEESGLCWSPTALPRRGNGTYSTRHGFGYSVFEHSEDGIYSELCVYVAMDASVKFASLKVSNDSTRTRHLSATGYVEWVLGDMRAKTAMHVSTEVDNRVAVLARNRYNSEFGERTAFFHVVTSTLEPITRSFTGDRTEFLGRNGSPQNPAAMQRKRLSGRVGAGLDPCAAIQVGFELAAGQTRELVFMLGMGRDRGDADALLNRFRSSEDAQEALAGVNQYWQHTLRTVQVSTPDPAVNLLANGWLLYQTLSSRLWARSGYYQSGGAFGFRDQLQDTLALVHAEPQRLRAQIVLCAAHQFLEGDVQHWWHPPLGRGVRTRCSDDYLWLPYALCRYLETTGDRSLLDEQAPFLQGRLLNSNEESYYDLPVTGNEHGSIYEHARRAIQNGLKFGVHGLPLMGSGDWNDGMNLVGEHGKGESVWLGFFLYSVLQQFGPVAQSQGDAEFAARCATAGQLLRNHIEAEAWDGAWYRRAYFDDGTPLGSASNSECRIDAIAQSWSVLSGAGAPERARLAMSALHQHLVRPEDGLIQLLDPPFDSGTLNPGYIKGYLPGIRENGGQYTHGAIWASMAFAAQGDHEHAWQLFNIINPVNHGRTPTEVAIYKIEPYVMAADVYGVAPHIGRGGWSWYTGSAGWMYRLLIESLLGIHLQHDTQGPQLRIAPCMPEQWTEYSVDYQYGGTRYEISIHRAAGQEGGAEHLLPLVDDGQVHKVDIAL